jgi:hypothetical protein
MAKKPDSEETVPLEDVVLSDVVLSNVFTQEAIINLLEKKGLLTKKEVIEEIKRLKVDNEKRKM